MAPLFGLLSVAGLSLFLARVLRRSASLMPVVALCLCMLWFTLAGIVGFLWIGGLVWYAGCLAAFAFVLIQEKKALLHRLTPGFLLFLAAGVFFILLFGHTQPLFSHWDEFTFWGTAAKATSETDMLYTVAGSNLIARTYPPGIILLSYAMQFFGRGFSEPWFFASLCMLYAACFAAATAVLDKRRAAAVLLFAALCSLPFLFEVAPGLGGVSWAWRIGYSDPALAALFGGALCLYFTGGEKDGRLALMLAAAMAALVNMKDIGLALALLVALVAMVDMVFCERKSLRVFRLPGWKGILAAGGLWLVCIAAAYALWALHLSLLPAGVNRFDVGAGGESLSQVDMLVNGALALVGINRSEQFSAVLRAMLEALYNRPVSLLGSGLRVFVLVVVLLAFAWLLCRTRAARRRVVVFFASGSLGFVLFYAFNIITYSYIFSWVEASVLKDYERYIGPYWQGWLLASLLLLAATAADTAGAAAWRAGMARLTLVGVSACLLGFVALRSNLRANVLRQSPSLYTVRQDVDATLAAASAEGMAAEDTVYIVSQGDDGTRFYMLGYGMAAHRVFLFGGAEAQPGGGYEYAQGNVAALLLPPGEEGYGYSYAATPEALSGYLALQGCTHILVDEADGAFVETFGGMFEDGLAGYGADGYNEGGRRYWRIEYGADGPCRFVPEGGGAG